MKQKNPKSRSCVRNGCQAANVSVDLARHMKLTTMVREFWFSRDFWEAQEIQERVAAQIHKIFVEDAQHRKSQAGVLLNQVCEEFPRFKERADRATGRLRDLASVLKAVSDGNRDLVDLRNVLQQDDIQNGVGTIMEALNLLKMVYEIV